MMGEDENWHVVRMLAYSMPDDEADYLEDDENVLIEEKFFENGKCRLYDLGGEEDSDEYVCQCQIITEHQFTLFTLSCEGKDEAMGFSADFIDHLIATKTNKHDKLLQQIEQWNADDEEQKIIDAILKVPEEERTAELTGLLARSYNNQGNYNEAIEQLLSVKEECKEDALWFYRLGYAYYYLNQLDKAQKAFERSLDWIPAMKMQRNTLKIVRMVFCLIILRCTKRRNWMLLKRILTSSLVIRIMCSMRSPHRISMWISLLSSRRLKGIITRWSHRAWVPIG